MEKLKKWSGSLHKSFRLLPTAQFGNEDLLAFLNSEDGVHWRDIYDRLPYDASRSGGRGRAAREEDQSDEEDDGEGVPDPKRYRDPKQVFETCGLLWQDSDGRVWFTEFGRTVKRFMSHANEKNVLLLAQHAAFGLSACQLRNPTRAGMKYHEEMAVFPFRFIWEAMLKLDYRINSEELNRAIFLTRNHDMLEEAIGMVRCHRRTEGAGSLGEETITGRSKNDRIIPIIALASFGWTLFAQKDDAGYYTVKPECVRLLEAAVSLPAKHRDFPAVRPYVEAISNAACLPRDYR
jgi:hypothetical protein